MSNPSDITDLVDETIHRSILEFDPDIPASYQKWIEVLGMLEESVERSVKDYASACSLLGRIRAQLALTASMANEHVEAERYAASVLAVVTPEDPNFAFAVLTRAKALHRLGRHKEEIGESLRYIEEKTFPGQAALHLLSELVRDHPGEIDWKESLVSRVREYVRESPELSRSVQDGQIYESNPEEYILGVVSMDRKLSRERMVHARAKVAED